MIISHGRLVSSRLSRRSHPDCRATLWTTIVLRRRQLHHVGDNQVLPMEAHEVVASVKELQLAVTDLIKFLSIADKPGR